MVKTRVLNLPLSAEVSRSLRAGDIVSLNGLIVTGRDKVHKYLVEKKPAKADIPFDLTGAVIYHCGPVINKSEGVYRVIAAGPTTSMRVEMYEPTLIREYGIRGIIGKGGMGPSTLEALKETGSVYFHAVGGAAVYLADRIKRALDVWKLDEFGPTEAMWLFEIEDFPAIVTMDSEGNDIHRDIEEASSGKWSEMALKISSESSS
jgi:tartrate/fumarate subfamily iron-sulfur-dependent hydro-lyase beta chain